MELAESLLQEVEQDLKYFNSKEAGHNDYILFPKYPGRLLFRTYVSEFANRIKIYKRIKIHTTPEGFFRASEKLDKELQLLQDTYDVQTWRFKSKDCLVMGVNVYSTTYDRVNPGFYHLVFTTNKEITPFLSFLSSLNKKSIEELFDLYHVGKEAYPIQMITVGEGKKKTCSFTADALSGTKVPLPQPPANWSLENALESRLKDVTEEDIEKIKALVMGGGKTISAERIAKELDDEVPFETASPVSIVRGDGEAEEKSPSFKKESSKVVCELKKDCESDPDLARMFPNVDFGNYPMNKRVPTCVMCQYREDCIEETKKRLGVKA